jgi:hypothetical protein
MLRINVKVKSLQVLFMVTAARTLCCLAQWLSISELVIWTRLNWANLAETGNCIWLRNVWSLLHVLAFVEFCFDVNWKFLETSTMIHISEFQNFKIVEKRKRVMNFFIETCAVPAVEFPSFLFCMEFSTQPRVEMSKKMI